MIEIRVLEESDLKEVVALRIDCWTEELAGKASNTLSPDKELEFWTNWSKSAEEYDDVRLLIGAFENNEMLGVAIGSFAETSDIPKNGIELNGLWISSAHRNKGISLILLEHLLEFYKNIEIDKMVVYNLHHSPSNTFYRKFGFEQVHQIHQMQGKLEVDIFNIELDKCLVNIRHTLAKYR